MTRFVSPRVTLTSGQVAELVLHHDPCNEIGLEMLADLEDCLVELAGTPPRVLILRSANPRGFSAGADLKALHRELEGASTADADARLADFIERIHALMTGLDELDCPTIAVINGICFGGGFELALTADIRIAERTARFAFPELRLGLIPGFGGIPRLRREIGSSVLMDLLLTGRSVNVKKALSVGLVSQMVPTGGGAEAARSMAVQLCGYDQHATIVAKRFAKSIPHDELARERRLFLSLARRPEVRDALARFAESDDLLPYVG